MELVNYQVILLVIVVGVLDIRGDGIYKSTDGGNSWSVLSSTSSNKPQSFNSNFNYVWTVQVAPANGYVIAATYNGIKRSIDGGDTWTDILEPSTGYL